MKFLLDITWGRYVYFVLVLQVLEMPLAWGGEWRITPEVEVKGTYTDNVTLAPEGEEEWDFVTQINPIIRINGTGRRLNLSLTYRLQTLFYAQDSSRNDIYHQLAARADVELVKERFFIDAGASFTQRNIFDSGRVADDNINVTGNRTDAARVFVEPIWRERWGGYANTELRYQANAFRYDTDRATDSNYDRAYFTAQNGPRSTQLTWNFDARYRKEERIDREDDFEEYRSEGEARWPAGRQLYLLGVIGREESDFRTTRDLTNGNFWSIGAGWSPSRFFTVEAGKGKNNEFASLFLNPSSRSLLTIRYRDRAVGSNPGRVYDARFHYRTRKARFQGGYSEQATTAQQTFAEVATFPRFNPFGETITDQVGSIVCRTDRGNTPSLTDEVFIRKRFDLFGGISAGRKQDFGLTVFSERLEFEELGDADDGVGACFSWNWRIRRRTSLTSIVEFIHVDFRESDPVEDEADNGLFRLRLSHRFARRLTGSLEYRYRNRESSNDEFSFDENRIEARIRKTF